MANPNAAANSSAPGQSDKDNPGQGQDKDKSEKEKQNDAVKEKFPRRKTNTDEVMRLSKGFVKEQGYSSDGHEINREGMTTIRLTTKGGSIISSITVPPSLVDEPVDAVAVYIRAQVLDALAAGVKEPALRQEKRGARG